MKLIRLILRVLILAFDRWFTPSPIVKRSPEAQEKLNIQTHQWSLYQLEACPFCVKVRRHMKRLAIEIPLKNVTDSIHQSELMAGGKIDQVPCLRYSDSSGVTHWLYESTEINAFLSKLA